MRSDRISLLLKRRKIRHWFFNKKRQQKINDYLKSVDFDNRCLICCDLDGTLLNSKSEISKYSEKVIKKLWEDKRYMFCILTARPRRSSIQFYNQLGLHTPLVNYNGARLFNPRHSSFAELNYFISTEIIYEIFSKKNIMKLVDNVVLETPDGTFFLKDQRKTHDIKEVRKALEKFNIYTTKDINYVSDNFAKLKFGAYSILVALKDMSKAVELSKQISKICSNVIVRSWTEEHVGTIVEINSLFPSKGMSLKYLSVYYDVPLERCYFFGDNDNDKEALQLAGHGYAMKNGTAEAKKAANEVTEYTNDEDGVARELNKIFKLGVAYEKASAAKTAEIKQEAKAIKKKQQKEQPQQEQLKKVAKKVEKEMTKKK